MVVRSGLVRAKSRRPENTKSATGPTLINSKNQVNTHDRSNPPGVMPLFTNGGGSPGPFSVQRSKRSWREDLATIVSSHSSNPLQRCRSRI